MARSDLPSHSDIEETVQENNDNMSEKIEEMEILTDDTETVRDALASLDLNTTVEGSEEVESSVESAEDVTVGMFDTEDSNMDGIQSEAKDYADQIDDRHDSAESDLDQVRDAVGRIETDETIGELENAESCVEQEMDFLKENNEEAEQAREESEQSQQELQSRINSGRRS